MTALVRLGWVSRAEFSGVTVEMGRVFGAHACTFRRCDLSDARGALRECVFEDCVLPSIEAQAERGWLDNASLGQEFTS